jgi:hypothetical protein
MSPSKLRRICPDRLGCDASSMSHRQPEFALRLSSADALFYEFDARPLAERHLRDDVHEYLLYLWERVRDSPPGALTLVLPAAERPSTDEAAIRAAIRADLRASCGPLRHAGPLTRENRVTLVVGLVALVLTIGVATVLSRLTDNLVVEGIAEGITLIGWVAMWAPADHFFRAVVPHAFNRRRYREFADVDVRFSWI